MTREGNVGKGRGSFGKDPETLVDGVLGSSLVPLLPWENEAAALDVGTALICDWYGVNQLDGKAEVEHKIRREVVFVVPDDLVVGHAGQDSHQAVLNLFELRDVGFGDHVTATGLLEDRIDDVLADLGLSCAVPENRGQRGFLALSSLVNTFIF